MNFHTTPSKKSDKTPHSEALEPDHVGDFTLLETAYQYDYTPLQESSKKWMIFRLLNLFYLGLTTNSRLIQTTERMNRSLLNSEITTPDIQNDQIVI